MLFFPFLCGGCQLFESLKDAVDELTQPVLLQAVYVGVEELDPSAGIDLSGTEMSSGSTVSAYVYDANLSSGTSPATGAKVSLISASLGSVGLAEGEPGSYAADASDGLDYRAGDDVEVVADYGGVRHRIAMNTPDPADVAIEEDHTPGMGISIDLRGQGYDNAVVMVFDVSGEGGTVWESDIDPTSPRDSDNLTHSIPGSVFKDGGLYVVGVVGLEAADEEDFYEVQALGSGMLAGTMALFPVSTLGSFDTGSF